MPTYISARPVTSPSSCSTIDRMRSFSSAAAFSVNVNATMLRGSTPGLREDLDDPLRDHLRLARPGARDDLQRLVEASRSPPPEHRCTSSRPGSWQARRAIGDRRDSRRNGRSMSVERLRRIARPDEGVTCPASTTCCANCARKDPALAADLEREVAALADRRAFGLNFERHVPEAVELPGRKVRKGDKVRVLPPRGERRRRQTRLWRVVAVDRTATRRRRRSKRCRAATRVGPETTTAALDDLVVVAEFRDPIYPGLVRPATSNAAATSRSTR